MSDILSIVVYESCITFDNHSNNFIHCGINNIIQIELLELNFNQSFRGALFHDQQTLLSVKLYPIGIVDMKTEQQYLFSGNWTNGGFNNTGKVMFSILLNIIILEY